MKFLFYLFLILSVISSCSYREDHQRTENDTVGTEVTHLASFDSIIDPEIEEQAIRSLVIERSLEIMSIEEKIGQLLMIQLRYSDDGRPLRTLQPQHLNQLKTLGPGGVILFGENLHAPQQAQQFIQDLKHHIPGPPPIIAVDQEGGLVDRLRSSPDMAHSTTRIPSAWELGNSEPDAPYLAGLTTGNELRELGITMNLAPVADLSSRVERSFLGTRTFGGDPEHVGSMVQAFIRGLTDSAIASVAKHFPGHGDTVLDSHYHLISFDTDLEGLLSHDLIPFIRAIESQVSGIMAAHISFPAIDPSQYPASISPILLRGILRDTLGFEGLIITDALEMMGIRKFMEPEEASVQAILAGADIILTPFNPWPTYNALLNAYSQGILTEQRINESVRRILHHKSTWQSRVKKMTLYHSLK